LLIIWKDVTEERKAQIASEKDKLALNEQKLANLLKTDQLQAAMRLALKLKRPTQALEIIKSIIAQIKIITNDIIMFDVTLIYIFITIAILQKGNKNELEEIIKELNPIYKETLLEYVVKWNMKSRHSRATQV